MADHQSATTATPAAAWYQDPDIPSQIRYWDGSAWTEHVSPISGLEQPEGHEEVAAGSTGRRSLGLADRSQSDKEKPHRQSLGFNDGGISRYDHRNDTRHNATVDSRNSQTHHAPAGADANSVSAAGFEAPELGSGWHVAEDIHLSTDLHIEHLVIGPPGVFALGTKDHSGSEVWVAERSFLVDGHQTEYLRNARHCSRAVSQVLSSKCGFDVAVSPVIVVKTNELRVKAQPNDAHVVAFNLVGRWFSRLEPRFRAGTIYDIWDVVSDAATWVAPTEDQSAPSEPAPRRSLFS